ncbi:protease complex subunit PrcB family protein [Gilvimarinus algae]|uniref:Protease complex subunit PrcB family protein n=1 Tax=Gilvimarinus algae TaxID=3058037 RepID=A0ABT8TJH1_9GAMM|nr:protease complex subunit PrcB family protein [Gilvimarinus sp. SDUM040014]MDO3383649.1 protease complex subunit PrcB family protein [Gilvimarinus sp. SDUM040014]
MYRPIGVLSVISLLAACGGSDSHQSVDFEPIDCPGVSSHSAYEDEVTEVFDTSHAFREWYLATNLNEQVTTPEVDFDQRQVIAINTGFKPSLSYSVQISRIEDEGDHLMVHYVDTGPLSCAADAAISYPYCVVVIDKTAKAVRFEGEVVDGCD